VTFDDTTVLSSFLISVIVIASSQDVALDMELSITQISRQ